jgi:hypothetical protein
VRVGAASLLTGLLLCGAAARAVDIPPVDQPNASEPAKLSLIPFKYTFHGFIKAGYVYVPYNPDVSPLVGRDAGFRMYNSRLGFSGSFGEHVDFELSLDSQFQIDPQTGLGPVSVGFADAFTTLHWGAAYLQLGQFKTPFNGEFLLDDQYVPFARRSAISDGLLVDEATSPQAPISLDRELGAMLGVKVPLAGKLAFTAQFAAVNGNGPNQARNDNSKVALVGRVGVGSGLFSVNASGFWNDRTAGVLAERQDERDYAGDLDFLFDLKGFRFGNLGAGFKIFGMAAYKKTKYLTIGQNQDKNSLGLVGSVAMPLTSTFIIVEPALRVAYFQPDSTLTNSADASQFSITDYTIGVNISPLVIPLRFQLNYTYRAAAAIWNQPTTLAEVAVQANF